MSSVILGKVVDERFLHHRLKSTSLAGIVGGVLAILLFGYRFYFNHLWSWDLFVVGMTFVVVKLVAMIWYHRTD